MDADAGDITCNPFNIDEAIKQIEVGAEELLNKVGGIICIGGDNTIAFTFSTTAKARKLQLLLLYIHCCTHDLINFTFPTYEPPYKASYFV